MKQSLKITCCGIISAISATILLATNIPIMLYAVPALAGIVFIVPTIEFGTKWGFLCFGTTSLVSLILPTEREALVVFIGILGYYPILKMLIERIVKQAIEYLLKLLTFNIAIICSYWVIVSVLGINAFENDMLGIEITIVLLLILGNLVFLLFDYSLTKILVLYFVKLRKPIRKTLGIKGKH